MLEKTEKISLISKAHKLQPVVTVGQKGVTENFLAEAELALEHHQLMKIKLPALDKKTKQEIGLEISEKLQATLLRVIGRVLIVFRKRST